MKEENVNKEVLVPDEHSWWQEPIVGVHDPAYPIRKISEPNRELLPRAKVNDDHVESLL